MRKRKDRMLFFLNNKTWRIIDRNRCLTMLTRPFFYFPSFTSSFFFQHNIKHRSAHIQNAKGQWHVRFHSFLFANQAASQSCCMLKAFFLSFVLRICSFFSSFAASHHLTLTTTISNHLHCIALTVSSKLLFLVNHGISKKWNVANIKERKSLIKNKEEIFRKEWSHSHLMFGIVVPISSVV